MIFLLVLISSWGPLCTEGPLWRNRHKDANKAVGTSLTSGDDQEYQTSEALSFGALNALCTVGLPRLACIASSGTEASSAEHQIPVIWDFMS